MKLNIKSMAVATIAAMILIVVLVIWAEQSESFKTSIANVTGHHWTSKGLFAVMIFVLSYLIFAKSKETNNTNRIAYYAIWTAVLGSLAIFLFFAWHFFS